ncbi:conserved hypothetical protein [Burkholderiales bacterium 8X]|nr:conserved hypothetical protein [Burkholderiales bacterium 8X]
MTVPRKPVDGLPANGEAAGWSGARRGFDARLCLACDANATRMSTPDRSMSFMTSVGGLGSQPKACRKALPCLFQHGSMRRLPVPRRRGGAVDATSERMAFLVPAQIGLDHHEAELFQRGSRLPAQLRLCACRIADQQIDLGRPVELLVDSHQGLAGRDIDADLMLLLAFEAKFVTRCLERHVDELANRLGAVGGQHEAVGFIGLQHHPHAFDVFLGEAPVALGAEVAEFEHARLAELDLGDTVGDLAGHELTAAQRAFVVEEDAAAAEDVVAFPVVDGHPVREQLGDAVGAARIEGGFLDLRNGLHLAEHLGGGGLVEADIGVGETDGLEQVQGAHRGDLGGGVGLVEADADEALGCQVVHLVRLGLFHEGQRTAQVGQVVFDQVQVGMILNAEFLDPPEIHGARTAIGAINDVALAEQQLGKISAILAGDAGDNRAFLCWGHGESFQYSSSNAIGATRDFAAKAEPFLKRVSLAFLVHGEP